MIFDRHKTISALVTIAVLIILIWIIPQAIDMEYNKQSDFIQECNDLYGDPTWDDSTYDIVKVDEWTSYSDEFWQTHPKLYIDNGFNLENDIYTCFGK